MFYGRMHRLLHLVFCALIYSIHSFASDISIQGTMVQHFILSDKRVEVPFVKINLSSKAKTKLSWALKKELDYPHHILSSGILPSAIDLGMGNIPVLNQGIHGSCVTFAAVAAIDALLEKGDYVSPLCSLQLGRFLESYGYVLSGWNGGFGDWTLSQLTHFGFISKDKQQQFGCGGLTEYPLFDSNLGQAMTAQEFHQYSESLEQNRVLWTHIVDVNESLMDDVDKDNLLLQVKLALNHGDRVMIGLLLADYERGLVGAVGMHKAFNDTWVLTPEIVENSKNHPLFAGHAMVIMGYDDEAIAKDDQGRVHQGLLKLRNSWGNRIGDQGNFYISYDYFKALVIELHQIRSLTQNKNRK